VRVAEDSFEPLEIAGFLEYRQSRIAAIQDMVDDAAHCGSHWSSHTGLGLQ
jgi:hypothetical protein